MASTGLSSFKTTSPSNGTMRFLVSGSAHAPSNAVTHSVIGVTVSVFDCTNASRLNAVANLKNFTIGSDTITVINGVPQGDNRHYYYDISPIIETGSLATYQGVCTLTSLTPPPRIDTFKNSPFNAVFNNAIVPRRIHRTGSKGATVESGQYGGIFEIDRSGDQIVPSNLDAIISRSAATASFQESNLYTKSWTLPRYEGSKLNSGSLFFNDPALTFTSFKGVKFPELESSSYIRTQSYADLDVKEYYFNPPYNYTKGAYEQGSIIAYPPSTQPIYELEGKDFKRITKSKVYLPGTGEIIVLNDDQVVYEATPGYTALPTDNIFYVNISTTANVVVYSYYRDNNGGDTGNYLSPGPGDNIYVSGSYISSLNRYVLDAASTYRANHAVSTGAGPGLDNKTVLRLISSSRNIT